MLKRIRSFACLVAVSFTLSVGHAQAGAGYDTTFVVGTYGSGGKTGGAGVFLGFYDTGSIRKIVHSGAMIDLGIVGPVPTRAVDGNVSINYLTTYATGTKAGRARVFPFVKVGYSRLFATGNAVNYGAGILWRYRHGKDSGIRFEGRDCWVPGVEHIPGFRISFESALSDQQAPRTPPASHPAAQSVSGSTSPPTTHAPAPSLQSKSRSDQDSSHLSQPQPRACPRSPQPPYSQRISARRIPQRHSLEAKPLARAVFCLRVIYRYHVEAPRT
jgi:hypothetical protein